MWKNNINDDGSLADDFSPPCSDVGFLNRTVSHRNAEALEILEGVWNCLADVNAGGKRPRSWEDCVTWARCEWETQYNNDIRQLLHCFPPDQVKTTIASEPRGVAVAPVSLFVFRSIVVALHDVEACPCCHGAPRPSYARLKSEPALDNISEHL